jgi:FtsP/CotA-like multicopper oxidase with cupredoxin domain
MVNGKTWPYLQVEPRRYRFRVVNGSNARFYDLHLIPSRPHAAEARLWQIGTDGGLLDAPVALNDPASASPQPLILAPGERADLIIDFSDLAGQNVVLRNIANGPYPDGDPVDPATTGQVMQFRVGRVVSGGLDFSFNPVRNSRLRRTPIERPTPPAVTRALTLNEVMGEFGPLAGYVNNTMWEHTPSENLLVGNTEVWQIVNLTGDTHPVHLHLIQFQVLSRQDFDADGYLNTYGMPMAGMGAPLPYAERSVRTGFKLGGNPDVTPFLLGSPLPVDANENGWKDTFRMNPGQVTTLLVRIAPQDAAARTQNHLVPGMNLFAFDPSAGMGVTNDGFGFHGGPGYVWHCHILDHEDNDMMRPMLITSPGPGVATAGGGTVDATSHPAVQLAKAQPNPALGSARIAFSLAEACEPVGVRSGRPRGGHARGRALRCR